MKRCETTVAQLVSPWRPSINMVLEVVPLPLPVPLLQRDGRKHTRPPANRAGGKVVPGAVEEVSGVEREKQLGEPMLAVREG